ncbi:MAG: hemolysin family protein [Clostridia bacterium]|nr:hemolysin family protein [Clostridia bacterium]
MRELIWGAAAIAALLILSAFFSGSETAYAAPDRLRPREAAAGGGLRERLARRLRDARERVLVTILLGNNLANTAASAIAALLAVLLLGRGGAWLAALVMTILIVCFGELLPKRAAARDAERYAAAAALPLTAFDVLLFPLVWLSERACGALDRLLKKRIPEEPAVTEDELETLFDAAGDAGVIDEDCADLLQSALSFDELSADEALTPRVDMLAVDADDAVEDILGEILDAPFSRIPVYRDTEDNIIGVLHLNRVLKELAAGRAVDVEALMLPPVFVYRSATLPDVLEVMKRKKSHLVIVTDEYGGTVGLLTMEDVLEQLVGDIWDESDIVEDSFVSLGNNRYDVDAAMPLADFFGRLGLDDSLPDADAGQTLGDWVLERLGRCPRAGDSLHYQNLTITVRKRKRLKVLRLLVTVYAMRIAAREA